MLMIGEVRERPTPPNASGMRGSSSSNIQMASRDNISGSVTGIVLTIDVIPNTAPILKILSEKSYDSKIEIVTFVISYHIIFLFIMLHNVNISHWLLITEQKI